MVSKNKITRPVSPHLTVYSPQMSSMLSVFHRIAGSSIGLVLVMVLCILSCVKMSHTEPFMFCFVGLLQENQWLFWGPLFFVLLLLSFHIANGVRHFIWDGGIGIDSSSITKTGLVVLGCAGFVYVWMLQSLFF